MPPGDEEWSKESKFVLRELKRLADAYEEFPKVIQKLTDKVNEELTELKTEVAILKVKAGIWGLIGGVITASIFYLSRYVGG